MSDNEFAEIWESRVSMYRMEPDIANAIAKASKKTFNVDPSLINELGNSFPFLRNQDEDIRIIRGPSDLNRGLAVAAELQALKDRAAEITLRVGDVRSRLERLKDVVRIHVFLKKEVVALKNDAQRNAVVSLTCPEIENPLSLAVRVLEAAELVTKNVNQSYNILRVQVDIIKEMMYEGGLGKAQKLGDRA